MKKLLIIFLFPTLLLSQKNKDISFVPMGTFEYKFESDTATRLFSVQAIHITNKITNKEYREFVNYLKRNPGDSLSIFNLKKFYSEKPHKGSNLGPYFITKKNSELLKDIIDTTVWNKYEGKENYSNYFSDKKFDNYPVVGVNYENASWYCIWRSKTENDKRIQNGQPLENDWRVPTESEWLYVASLQTETSAGVNKLQPVKKGKANNSAGIKNLDCNVAEWTSAYLKPDLMEDVGTNGKKIIIGGSFDKSCGTNKKETVEEGQRFYNVGFRMVRTYRPPMKDEL